ncbi:DUF58 domain-containing protein [Planctomyces sp. SH-PL62]|uniref:DUF58 domain-containing protein n=1 Tax=Planctomyces sp. SH-PL62 TaxID=1636152 RepID=UPI00078B2B0D|nr:DUF58 domain-containing protein [Planctomyces sp. SH-PL62]AMV38238.1 hypothetical protein VT85_12425 [Planctomyces sp. SH-PL62]
MIIPTRRMMWLAATPLVAILISRGDPAGVGAAWALAGLLLAAMIVDGLVARRLPIRLTRRAPDQLHVDQPDSVSLTVENRANAPVRLLLSDRPPEGSRAIPAVLAVQAPPRSRTAHDYELIPTRRGPTAFGDLDYRVLGPMGLAWAQKRLPARHEVRCMPRFANARAAELAERRALLRQAGSHRFRWRGTGTSFESLREYSTQDDIRWVDWKATARLNRPISRNFEVERHQQVMILVDSSRALTTFCGSRTKFDAMLEAAVLLTRTALGQGDDLGLMVFADQIDLYLHPRREQTQLNAVVEGLYARQPRLVEPNFELALTLAAKRTSRRTLCILLTDVTVIEAARRMLLYSKVLTQRHRFLVVTIADETLEENELREPRDAEELYRVGVAAGLMQERTVLLEELRRSGVEVLDSRADQVASRAIERYLDLKRRNML